VLQFCVKEIIDFLPCETSEDWVIEALRNQKTLLIDHANCEKKAASTALSLIYRYPDNYDLVNKMSKLIREEMRHFEQVIHIMRIRGIKYHNIDASRYASGLRKMIRTYEPARLVDTLIVGAYIEARSCERFSKLAPNLDEDLKKFYLSLLRSESRHFQDYLHLAKNIPDDSFDDRIKAIGEKELVLIKSFDNNFYFHSGSPQVGV
jgi:tRNA-(ms[2]io[6]A)-hydroxylase